MTAAVDVRTPEGLRAALVSLDAGEASWDGPVGVVVLERVRWFAREALGRTPGAFHDPHLVDGVVSHVWERLTVGGGSRSVVGAVHPGAVLRVMVQQVTVQVSVAGLRGVADPSATARRVRDGVEVGVRLDAALTETELARVPSSTVAPRSPSAVDELAAGLASAVEAAWLRAGRPAAEAAVEASKVTDALHYVVNAVATDGITAAYKKLRRDVRLAELVSWDAARAMVLVVTGVTSGQASRVEAQHSVLARLFMARKNGDTRPVAEVVPDWRLIESRVVVASRPTLPPPPAGQGVAGPAIQLSLFEAVGL